MRLQELEEELKVKAGDPGVSHERRYAFGLLTDLINEDPNARSTATSALRRLQRDYATKGSGTAGSVICALQGLDLNIELSTPVRRGKLGWKDLFSR